MNYIYVIFFLTIFLVANKITNITKIKFLPQLTKISFCNFLPKQKDDMPLDEASCDHILKIRFNKLK